MQWLGLKNTELSINERKSFHLEREWGLYFPLVFVLRQLRHALIDGKAKPLRTDGLTIIIKKLRF